jgi:hypothetical protein
MADPVPFEEVTEDGYAQTFVDACTVTPTRRGVLLAGTCPRCGDPMGFPLTTKVFLSGTPGAAAAEKREVLCTCQVAHPGRPSGEEGCGAYWNVTPPESAP